MCIIMEYLIILAIVLALLPKSRKTKKKNKARPWYDVSYEDMITYDLFDDD